MSPERKVCIGMLILRSQMEPIKLGVVARVVGIDKKVPNAHREIELTGGGGNEEHYITDFSFKFVGLSPRDHLYNRRGEISRRYKDSSHDWYYRDYLPENGNITRWKLLRS